MCNQDFSKECNSFSFAYCESAVGKELQNGSCTGDLQRALTNEHSKVLTIP